jgi:hypothetical protein
MPALLRRQKWDKKQRQFTSRKLKWRPQIHVNQTAQEFARLY